MKKYDVNNFSFNDLEDQLEYLRSFLKRDVLDNKEWLDEFKEILSFQDEDGSFNLFSSLELRRDARRDFVFYPSYLVVCLMIKVTLQKQNLKIDNFKNIFKDALYFVTLRDFDVNSLYGDDFELNMELFINNDIIEFLSLYSHLSPIFTNTITKALYLFDNSLIIPVKYVFVYGTLMEGGRFHYALEDAIKIGNSSIDKTKLLELGNYPGLIEGNGVTLGEIYQINENILHELDRIEGEGSLFQRRERIVKLNNGAMIKSYVYYYLNAKKVQDEDSCKVYSYKDITDYIWYVSYGSNTNFERFSMYIDGKNNTRYKVNNSRGCQKSDYPLANLKVEIPFEMYYGRNSPSWDNKGVAFIDENKKGKTCGKAYLIHKTQFNEIRRQEGWYPLNIKLDDIHGLPAYTFTSNLKHKKSKPSKGYIRCIMEGLLDSYSLEDIEYVGG